jgi:hypothetical protein
MELSTFTFRPFYPQENYSVVLITENGSRSVHCCDFITQLKPTEDYHHHQLSGFRQCGLFLFRITSKIMNQVTHLVGQHRKKLPCLEPDINQRLQNPGSQNKRPRPEDPWDRPHWIHNCTIFTDFKEENTVTRNAHVCTLVYTGQMFNAFEVVFAFQHNLLKSVVPLFFQALGTEIRHGAATRQWILSASTG